MSTYWAGIPWAKVLQYAGGVAVVRWFLTATLLQSWGLKAIKHQAAQKPSKRDLAKWKDSAWKATVYVFLASFGLIVSINKPWFTDTDEYFKHCHGWPCQATTTPGQHFLYQLALGYYLQGIFTAAFFDVKRTDTWAMVAHHVVTFGLIAYSYALNVTAVGCMIMLVHDICDPFLEGAKLANYAGNKGLADKLYFTFAGMWVVCRLGVFPFCIIRTTLFDGYNAQKLYGFDPHPHWACFNTLLVCVFMLQLFWTYFIVKAAVKFLGGGKLGDSRDE